VAGVFLVPQSSGRRLRQAQMHVTHTQTCRRVSRIYSSFLVCAFRHAAKGIHPSKDANGIDIGPAHSLYEDHGRAIVAVGPRIWRAVLVFAKGDLEFWANECGLPHWGSVLPCGAREICRAVLLRHRCQSCAYVLVQARQVGEVPGGRKGPTVQGNPKSYTWLPSGWH
jgi:hypothetical protein